MPAPAQLSGTEQPVRLLVADDDHLIASGMAASLRALGFDVVGPAPSGDLAVNLATSRPDDSPVDMAILDIRMPGRSGLEVARFLWESASTPSIIVSAHSDDVFLREASAAGGVFGYLLKPVSIESLRVQISIAWTRAAAEREKLDRIGQLEQNLRNRQTVEKAKWRLIERCAIGEPEAHTRLQKAARDLRQPLIVLAERVLQTEDFGFLGLTAQPQR